jgi:hypothetical protein
MFLLLQPASPVIVDVAKQPTPTRDISIDVVLAAFASAGVALLVAAVGGLIAGAIVVMIKRYRDARSTKTESDHVRLRI